MVKISVTHQQNETMTWKKKESKSQLEVPLHLRQFSFRLEGDC